MPLKLTVFGWNIYIWVHVHEYLVILVKNRSLDSIVEYLMKTSFCFVNKKSNYIVSQSKWKHNESARAKYDVPKGCKTQVGLKETKQRQGDYPKLSQQLFYLAQSRKYHCQQTIETSSPYLLVWAIGCSD